MMSVCGVSSEARLVLKTAALFPTNTIHVEADTVLHGIFAMVSESVYKMASKPAQVKHGTVKRVLFSIVDKTLPEIDALVADLSMQPVMQKIEFFVRFQVVGSVARGVGNVELRVRTMAQNTRKANLERRSSMKKTNFTSQLGATLTTMSTTRFRRSKKATPN